MRLLWVFVLMLAFAIAAQAQNAGLTGTVYDPTGAVIPGAAVTAVDQNNRKYETLTNEAGVYEISLPIRVSEPAAKDSQNTISKTARYEISITSPGFEKVVFSRYMVIRTDRKMQLDAALNIGPVSGPVFVKNK